MGERMNIMNLRVYQEECIEKIFEQESGNYLIQMATGLGKTVTFANIINYIDGRMLILSHREELVTQPKKYFDCSFGIEQAKRKSDGERVISACVQSLVKRLDRFNEDDFEVIVVDEAHHTPAKTYQTILNYFRPRYVLGFTATPSRGDNIGLSETYKDIIYQKDLRWGIKNDYLCNIECKRVDIGFNLKGVKSSNGDFQVGKLDDEVNIDEANEAIADVYYKYAKGQTLIFGVTVNHCYKIAEKIKGAVVIDAKTKNREEIIEKFTNREIPVLVNCMIFTEGTDIPLIETIIMARPTKNASLYIQMVGRGLRLAEGKENLLLIDCVGASNLNICSAPTLLGLKMDSIPDDRTNEIEGDLFDLEGLIFEKSDCPKSWIKNIQLVDLWAKENDVDLRGINFYQLPDGGLKLSIPGFKTVIPAQDELGYITCRSGNKIKLQEAVDMVYKVLLEKHLESRPLWNLDSVKRWGKKPASQKQIQLIEKKCNGMDIPTSINMLEANQILNRVLEG
jgi:superfamily II DNA or RNA helicase